MSPHFLVVDLEATCTDSDDFPREQMETIEIGAVLCAPQDAGRSAFQALRTFQTFIQPVRNPHLTPFCTRLTTITQADVAAAPRFPAAIAALQAFLTAGKASGADLPIFCSWGDYDWHQLQRDAAYHRVNLPGFVRRLNLKERFQEQSGGAKLGMARALKRAGLPLLGTHHRGIDDARNIAALLPYALGKRPLPSPTRADAPSPSVGDPLEPFLRRHRR